MIELNRKLAEWAGFIQLPNGRTGYHFERGEKVMNWMPPGVSLAETFRSYERTPGFTWSLDACFKWLVPKLFSQGHLLGLVFADVSASVRYRWTVNLANDEIGVESQNDTPALALCLAIEKLIDGVKHE